MSEVGTAVVIVTVVSSTPRRTGARWCEQEVAEQRQRIVRGAVALGLTLAGHVVAVRRPRAG